MAGRTNTTLLAFLAACLGIGLFAVMDATMKHLSIAIGAYNAMLWRQFTVTGIGALGFLATRSGKPSPQAMRLTAIRGSLGAVMAFTFFWGLKHIPLAEGTALSFIAPLIALYLAAVLLKEKIGRGAIIASGLGIAGVVVIAGARLGAGNYDRDTLLGIASIFVSAVLYAYNLILQRQVAQVASPVQVGFFQNLFAFATTMLVAPFLAALPDAVHWPVILLSAGLTYISLLLLSWAYARAEAQILLPVEYTAFIWAALLGWAYFDEGLTPWTVVGTVLIVTGCIVAARQKPDRAEHIEMA